MKKSLGLTLLLSFSFLAHANDPIDFVLQYSKDEAERAVQRDKNIKANFEMYEKNIPLFEKRLKDAEQVNSQAAIGLLNYDKLVREVKEYVEKGQSELTGFQRLASRKKNFLNCLESGLQKNNFPDVKNCRKQTNISLTTEDNIFFRDVEKKIIAPKETLKELADKSTIEIRTNKEQLAKYLKSKKEALDNMYAEESALEKKTKEKFVKDYQALKTKPESFKCSPGLKTIDLEQEYISDNSKIKGPFYKVKQDNQDGLGTCYANAAKNMLVGLSGGEMVGSFLDMALQYKLADGTYSESGLDGGHSCETLRVLKQKGFCEQKHAPTEMGETNEILNGFLNPKFSSIRAQRTIISSLKDFFDAKKTLSNDEQRIRDIFLDDPKHIISLLKENQNVQLPFPIVHKTPGNNRNLRNIFIDHATAKTEANLQRLEREIAEYDKKFKPTYVSLAISNASIDKVIEMYKDGFQEILKKYTAEKAYDTLMKDFEKEAKFFYTEDSRRQLYESAQFIHSLSNKNDMSFERFAASCIEVMNNGISLIESLRPVIRTLDAFDIPVDKILDNNTFKEDAELLYLAVAPSCINSENRKKIDFEFSCSEGRVNMTNFKNFFGNDTKALEEGMRARVVNSLSKGLPLGNSFPMNGGFHINTIVGVRYNAEKQGCEYKIRESQTGHSTWQAESPIVDKIYSLTELGK